VEVAVETRRDETRRETRGGGEGNERRERQERGEQGGRRGAHHRSVPPPLGGPARLARATTNEGPSHHPPGKCPPPALQPQPPPRYLLLTPRKTHGLRQLTCAPISRGFRESRGVHTAGTIGTAVSIRYRPFYGSVCTHTRLGYGVRGYGCGVAKLNPRYTRIKP